MPNLSIHLWPASPSLPPAHCPVLVRIPTSPSRTLARTEVRTALRSILGAWSNKSPDQLPLHESAQGPRWDGDLDHQALDISLSYTTDEAWIGLLRSGLIGVDVMAVEAIEEMDRVAGLYLGPAVAAEIRCASDPILAFASAWTCREARLKCLKRALIEWTPDQASIEAYASVESVIINSRLVGAVAVDQRGNR